MSCGCTQPLPSPPTVVTLPPVACAVTLAPGPVVTPGYAAQQPQTTLPPGWQQLVARVEAIEAALLLMQSQVQAWGAQVADLREDFDNCVTCPEPTS